MTGNEVDFSDFNIWFAMRTVCIIVLTGYIGVSVLLTVFQSHMVYYPVRTIDTDPGSIELPFEDVFFESNDRVKLHGWFVPANPQQGVLLFCHGNGGNISHRLETIRILNRLGLSVFIFDYRGYGRSEGKADEQGTYADAEAALRWIAQHQNRRHGEIIIMGRSLGGAIASWLAQKHTPKALILESAFTSISDLGAALYPWLPVRLLSRYRYSTREYITKVNCPVLIVHSFEDDLVPFSHGSRLFDLASEPKEFLELIGGHNDGFLVSGNRYLNGLEKFIARYGRE